MSASAPLFDVEPAAPAAPVEAPPAFNPAMLPVNTQEFAQLWRKRLQYKELHAEAENGLRQDGLMVGFQLKVERIVSPALVMTHAIELGGYHPKDDRVGPMGMPSAPKTYDPAAYEFSMRYSPKPGNLLSSVVRTDGFMFHGLDLRLTPWLDVHMAGQYFGENTASVIAAEIRGKDNVTSFKMVQQVAYEMAYAHQVSRNLTLGTALNYETMTFWSSSSVAARYVSAWHPNSSPSMPIPRAVTTIEAGTLGHKDQSLAVPKKDESRWEGITRPLGFISVAHWMTWGDNYRISGIFKLSKEGGAERKGRLWMPSLKLALEFVTPLAQYRGVVDPLNFEVSSELREEIDTGLVWSMSGKVNYWDQTYRFGAGLQMQT